MVVTVSLCLHFPCSCIIRYFLLRHAARSTQHPSIGMHALGHRYTRSSQSEKMFHVSFQWTLGYQDMTQNPHTCFRISYLQYLLSLRSICPCPGNDMS